MSIGLRIRELRKNNKLNQIEFSKAIDLDNSQLSKIEQGKLMPTLNHIMEISSKFNVSTDWLLMDKEVPEASAKYNQKGIPLLPFDAFAGIGSDIEGVDFNTIEERYEIPLFEGLKVDFMISVRGSSMYPKYSSGDVVACRLINELLFVQWNKVYVLDTVSQGVIMKRLKKSKNEDMLICKSDNENYDPFEIPKTDIRNIALVVGVIRLE